jgi:hypothetical protein
MTLLEALMGMLDTDGWVQPVGSGERGSSLCLSVPSPNVPRLLRQAGCRQTAAGVEEMARGAGDCTSHDVGSR